VLFFETKLAQFMQHLCHFIRIVGAIILLLGLYFAAKRCSWLCAVRLDYPSTVQWRP